MEDGPDRWDWLLLNDLSPMHEQQRRAQQLGVHFVDLSATLPSRDALACASGSICQRLGVVPVRIHDRKLFLAMKNPSDVDAIDEIATVTGFRVQPVLATAAGIDDALILCYDRASDD